MAYLYKDVSPLSWRPEKERGEVMNTNREKYREVIRDLLLLIKYETGLPDSAANGVVAPNSSDEGTFRAFEIIEKARNLMGMEE